VRNLSTGAIHAFSSRFAETGKGEPYKQHIMIAPDKTLCGTPYKIKRPRMGWREYDGHTCKVCLRKVAEYGKM